MSGLYVYLAEPIDLSSASTGALKRDLLYAGVSYYSPRGAWCVNDAVLIRMRTASSSPHDVSLARGVMTVNEQALTGAACVVAVLNGPSVGVPAEIQLARTLGVPVVALMQDTNYASSFMLRALLESNPAGGWAETTNSAVIDRVRPLMEQQRPVRELCALVSRDSDLGDLPLPQQAHAGDAGLDLYTSDDTEIPPRGWRGIPTRTRIAPPLGVWFLIFGRSSTLHKRGLLVVPSVIDSGFRGDLFALCFNITDIAVTVRRGERVAQLLPMASIPMTSTLADVLPESARGADGFGSTGA